MKKTKMLLLAACLLGTVTASAGVKPATSADAQNADAACAADAAAANCGSELVGTGLMKCIDAWHKASPKTNKLSAGCKAARKQHHADAKAKKAAKAAAAAPAK